MEDCTNPFSDNYQETDGEEPPSQAYEEEKVPDGPDVDNRSNTESTKDVDAEEKAEFRISSDAVADYLLQKKCILTALELHMELLEAGKELPRLRNYFSNPANFEQQGNGSFDGPSFLYRTGSISTFDSLDLTHSDDGFQQDDRVAVLEFELRKANETIRNLRMSLTGTLEEDSFLKVDSLAKDPDGSSPKKVHHSAGFDEVEVNPLIKRALNYLVNEYLLHNDYKLTSITLADEIEDQDFEDWDDVGLNMPKPPNLSKLFHDYSSRNLLNHNSCDACVGTDGALEEMGKTLQSMKEEIKRLDTENSELKGIISQVQNESHGLGSGISSTIPGISDYTGTSNHRHDPVPHSTSTVITQSNSETDMVEQKDGTHRKLSVLYQPLSTRMSSKFWDLLFSFWQDEDDDNDELSKEVSLLASSPSGLVSTLSHSLPEIIQSISPEKRHQILPLLLSTSAMQQDSSLRNLLLHNLFNLIEKPERRQRQIILSSCVAYAKVVGPLQTEEDLLPQFWEQIGHKHVERRNLVAEACGSIAPFLRAEMRSSLLLSILRQMQQEESNEKVREAIARSLAVLLALMEDEDKYVQAFEMVYALLKDKSLPVQQAARRYLLPSFACWSKQTGKLCDHLFDRFLCDVEWSIKDKEGKNYPDFSQAAFIDRLENLHALLPSLFGEILHTVPQKFFSTEVTRSVPIVGFDDELYRLYLWFEKDDEFLALYDSFCRCVEHASLEDWKPLSSLVTDFIPRLMQVVRAIHPTKNECVTALSEFFASIVTLFGLQFVKSHLKDKRSELFYMEGEEDINREISFENTPFTSAAVAVYGCGVLATCAKYEEKDELITFLNDTLVALATCHAPLSSLELAMIEIRKKGEEFHEIILDVLWSGIAHPSAFVRAAATSLFKVLTVGDMNMKVLTTRVMPAILSVSKDKEECVQTATLPVFGALLECSHAEDEVIDRVVAQLSSFMAPSDGSPPYHSMNVEMVKTMAEVTPKADPKFCNEFVLPHLAAIAARNNQQSNKTKRSDIALEMLQAFTNISFCYIPDSLLQSALIPGLRCLLQDLEKLHTEHVPKVERLIKDMESKLEQRTPVTIGDSALGSPTDKTKANRSKFYNKLF